MRDALDHAIRIVREITISSPDDTEQADAEWTLERLVKLSTVLVERGALVAGGTVRDNRYVVDARSYDVIIVADALSERLRMMPGHEARALGELAVKALEDHGRHLQPVPATERAAGGDRVQWDANHDQHARCQCGHVYYRHFASFAHMAPVGCTHCACRAFVLGAAEG